jgi:hypothetical protein
VAANSKTPKTGELIIVIIVIIIIICHFNLDTCTARAIWFSSRAQRPYSGISWKC